MNLRGRMESELLGEVDSFCVHPVAEVVYG